MASRGSLQSHGAVGSRLRLNFSESLFIGAYFHRIEGLVDFLGRFFRRLELIKSHFDLETVVRIDPEIKVIMHAEVLLPLHRDDDLVRMPLKRVLTLTLLRFLVPKRPVKADFKRLCLKLLIHRVPQS